MGIITEFLIQYGFPLFLLLLAYFYGAAVERKHYKSLRIRESASRNFLAVTFSDVPFDKQVLEGALLTGNVVISIDYFKRFLAGLRNLIGGRITSYETLLDRARREAIMRLKENALTQGYHAVINVRLETSRMASSGKNGKGTAGIEMLAFGTAVKFAR